MRPSRNLPAPETPHPWQESERRAYIRTAHPVIRFDTFLLRFRTTLPDLASRIGATFAVVRRYGYREIEADYDNPVYRIQFGDGVEVDAYAFEVCADETRGL